jgi:hypothetical protein
MDGAACELLEVNDGPPDDGAVFDPVVLGGGEHGLHRVDAVGEQHPEALRRRVLVGVYRPHVHDLQHRLNRPFASGVLGDGRHRAGSQLRRRHPEPPRRLRSQAIRFGVGEGEEEGGQRARILEP